jgi:cytochrome c oxidase subunit 4
MNDSSNTPSTSEEQPLAHVVRAPMLVGVFLVLILLTGVTVAASEPQLDLGRWGLVIALVIATVKASLVALYFMHLRYDNLFHAIVFVTALLFLGAFLSLTTLDTIQYRPDIDNWPA